ncbi:type I toxin-antitoxin system Ibs family toxin [Escherichia coli]|nr:type I toxin-antitoxin system Ibs family toxin [Escherichia coli]
MRKHVIILVILLVISFPAY